MERSNSALRSIAMATTARGLCALALVILPACGSERAPRGTAGHAAEPDRATLFSRWADAVADPRLAPGTRSTLQSLLAAARKDPRRAGELGLAFHGCDRLEHALECYALAARVEPRSCRWLRAMALARFDRGELDLAAASLRAEMDCAKLGESPPDGSHSSSATLAPLLLLGDLALRTERLAEAKQLFARARELQPECAGALRGSGRVALLEERDRDAEECLRAALRVDPSLASARHDLAIVLRRRGELDAVERLLDLPKEGASSKSADPWQSDPLRQEILAQREDAELLARRAGAAQREGRQEEALELYRRALRSEPEIHQNRYNAGVVLQSLGRHEEALAEYLAFLESRPEHADAWNNLGLAQLELGRLTEAEPSIQRAIELAPDHPGYRYNLGLVYSAQGHGDEAERAFEASLRADPAHHRARLHLAHAWMERGESDRARLLLAEGLERDHDALELQAALLHVEGTTLDNGPAVRSTAQKLAKSGFEGAALALLRANLLRSEDWRSGVTLAALLVSASNPDRRDPREALRILEPICAQAARADPIALDTLARTLVALGRQEEAIATAERAVDLARNAGNLALSARLEARLEAFRETLRTRREPPLNGASDSGSGEGSGEASDPSP